MGRNMLYPEPFECHLSWQEVYQVGCEGVRRNCAANANDQKQGHGLSGRGREYEALQWHYHFAGVLSEYVVSVVIDRSWKFATRPKVRAERDVREGRGLAQRGPDVSHNIQVQNTHHADGHFIVREWHAPDTICVLVTGEPPLFTVRGWFFAHEGKHEKYFRPNFNNRGPGYWIPQEVFHDIRELTPEKSGRLMWLRAECTDIDILGG